MSSPVPRPSRRQVLALAAGGAAGAAGLSVGSVLRHRGERAATASTAAAGAWPSPLGDPRGRAAHLLRRAGLGYGPAELDRAASMPYADLVEQLVSQPPAPAPAPLDPGDVRAVTAWWYGRMAATDAPFPERMVLFWHGLLTSDFRKAGRLPLLHQQNQLFRTRGTGDLRTLLLDTTYDPLMMRYLDLDQSSATSPNENYSRELMELFTMGPGNYTEVDVREGARALSGLRIVLVDRDGRRLPLPRRAGLTPQQFDARLHDLASSGAAFRGVMQPRLHDSGSKTYLGRTGDIGPEQAVDAILAKDACATFIAGRVLTAFCSGKPSKQLTSTVAKAFRSSHYDIRTMMRTVLLSEEFTAAANYRSLVRSPADLMVATMRALGRPDLAPLCTAAGVAMGQVPYAPPTVGGWPANGGWLSSSMVLARINFAQAVVRGGGGLPDPAAAVLTQLDGVVGPDTAAVLRAGRSDTDRWYALLASPEFQLK